MTSRGATVEFRHVTKRYERGSVAVEDLSLTVPAGEICALVGPSGCGKTTTLKMVNRLVEPTSGDVLIDGESVAGVDVTTLRRRIGYVIQHVGLFPHQTIAANVGTVPRLLGWPAARIAARVDELLSLVGLDVSAMRDRYPAQLSGGERQRVGFARALAAGPPVMLMDEPFGAVDRVVRERLQDEFLRLHRQLGMTVIFVTHDIDEALKVGGRVAVMQRGGRLEQYAAPAELLDSPANEFVARFVGADRALKRLALISVGSLAPAEAVTVGEGEPVVPGDGYVLVLDPERRPIGWVSRARPHLAPDASSPLFTADTSLRDALSMLLAAAVQTGVVVDEDGRYAGIVTLDALTDVLRASALATAS